MATAAGTVQVTGLRDLQRAFRAADKAVNEDLRDALAEAAQPVKVDAQRLAAHNIRRMQPSSSWARMRVGVSQTLVYVAPVERGVKGRGNNRRRRGYGTGPPSFADLLMDRALEPALEHNSGRIQNRLDQMLDEVANVWERT